MKKFFHLSALLLFTAIALNSCVSKKKYNELSSKKLGLEADKADCEEKLKTANAELERLNDLTSRLTKETDDLKADSTQKGKELRELRKTYASQLENNKDLSAKYDRLLTHSSAETKKLETDLARREKELKESEKRIAELQGNLMAREARVKELEKVLADKEQAVNDLKASVSKALLNFKEKDLTVNVKNGKVYVSLSEQLLFKSGSTQVDPKGIEALRKLAEVMKDQKDISVMVEGHTDDVPVAKGTVGVQDNWDLSVLRATEIVRILTNAGVNPRTVIPAGRGEFSPVAEGKSPEARQKNRRTEIILTPKLDELFQILEAN